MQALALKKLNRFLYVELLIFFSKLINIVCESLLEVCLLCEISQTYVDWTFLIDLWNVYLIFF